jgi:hypothetical protein
MVIMGLLVIGVIIAKPPKNDLEPTIKGYAFPSTKQLYDSMNDYADQYNDGDIAIVLKHDSKIFYYKWNGNNNKWILIPKDIMKEKF